MGGVIRGYADLDSIADHDLDSVFFHSSGQHTPYSDVIVTLDFHIASTQDFGNPTLYLNYIFPTQNIPFPAVKPDPVS